MSLGTHLGLTISLTTLKALGAPVTTLQSVEAARKPGKRKRREERGNATPKGDCSENLSGTRRSTAITHMELLDLGSFSHITTTTTAKKEDVEWFGGDYDISDVGQHLADENEMLRSRVEVLEHQMTGVMQQTYRSQQVQANAKQARSAKTAKNKAKTADQRKLLIEAQAEKEREQAQKVRQKALDEELKGEKLRKREKQRAAKAAKKEQQVEAAVREVENALNVEQEALQRRLRAAECLEALEQAAPSEVSSDGEDSKDGQFGVGLGPSGWYQEDPVALFGFTNCDLFTGDRGCLGVDAVAVHGLTVGITQPESGTDLAVADRFFCRGLAIRGLRQRGGSHSQNHRRNETKQK